MRKLTFVVMTIAMLLPGMTLAQRDLDTAAFDRDVRAQDDLFLHVNGTWLKNTEIPSDKSNYGSFTKLADLSQERIRELIEAVSKVTHDKGTDKQKVGDFYRSFMDTAAVEAAGLQPIAEELDKIDAIDSKEAMIAHVGYLQTVQIGSPIGFGVSQDAKDSTRYQVQLVQSGTTLPDRDYYLNDEEKSVNARKALKKYIMTLLDEDNAAEIADNIIALETKLAKAQWPRTRLRQAKERYNKHSLEELAKLTPKIGWPKFFEKANVKGFDDVNVMTPSFFTDLQSIIAETPLETWKQSLHFNTIDSYAPLLSKKYVDAHLSLIHI